MEINKEQTGNALKLILEGRLDTTTAPQLEEALKDDLIGIEELQLDFAGVDYISSAGLRVLLATQKRMSLQGKMSLLHVSESVMEIFELTGFGDLLTLQ